MLLPVSVCHEQNIFEKLEVLCKMAHSWKSEYHVFGETLLVLAEFSIWGGAWTPAYNFVWV